MLQISRLIMPVIMLVVVQCAEGNQRTVHVNELISNDDNFFTNGEEDNSLYVVYMETVLVIPWIMHWLILLVMFSLILQLM